MQQLEVFLYEKKIGTLSVLPGDLNVFAFEEEYIRDKNRATLSLSFKNKISGDLVENIRPTRIKIPPFFSNLLPEGHLRDYLASSAGINPEREFFLLQALGLDLPGALRLKENTQEEWPKEIFDPPETHLNNDGLRFSLAGIQLKFSALTNSSGGLTIPAQGVGGQWILKLPSFRFPAVPENEFAMLTLAKIIGINVPEIQLVSIKNILNLPRNIDTMKGKALAIKRFDRSEHGPIHIEDFAQVFGIYPNAKYNKINYRNIAEVLWAETGFKGIGEFVKRLVFNILIGNADMHAKNWSLIYPDRIKAELSPAYDFVSTIAYLEDDGMALNLVKTKKWKEVNLEQFSYLSAKANLPEKFILETVTETVHLFQEAWAENKKHLGLPKNILVSIEKHLKNLSLIKH